MSGGSSGGFDTIAMRMLGASKPMMNALRRVLLRSASTSLKK
jgi:hypothetical protein